ncbi:hypothetical protein EVAR_65244_1, partial [Eumeta japonica]
MNVSYDRVCRLCLSSRGELLAIFPTTSSDGSGSPVLASKIKACVSVQVNRPPFCNAVRCGRLVGRTAPPRALPSPRNVTLTRAEGHTSRYSRCDRRGEAGGGGRSTGVVLIYRARPGGGAVAVQPAARGACRCGVVSLCACRYRAATLEGLSGCHSTCLSFARGAAAPTASPRRAAPLRTVPFYTYAYLVSRRPSFAAASRISNGRRSAFDECSDETKCLDNVNNWYIFKKICERTQTKLLALIKKDSNLLEEVKIKNEPLSDEAYDDGVVIDGSYPDYEQNATSSNKLQPEGPPILASLGLTPRSDKKCVDPRLDWQRVHAILELIQEDEVIDSLQSAEECDVTQYSDHESDTDAEILSEIDDDYLDCKHGYLNRDRRFLSKTPKLTFEISQTIKKNFKFKKCKHDIIESCPQIKHAWQLIFSNDILEHIVGSTNSFITSAHNNHTNIKELKVFIGILYLHGLTRSIYEKRSDLWDERIGLKPVINSMSMERFTFLLKNIRFDRDQGENVDYDIMKSMRKVFEMFAMNCRTSRNIESTAVIDEIIIPVYGPCPFRYVINNKEIRNGMKMGLDSEKDDEEEEEEEEEINEAPRFSKVPNIPEVSITVMRPTGETLHARQGIQQLASKDCLVCGRAYRYSHNARRHELTAHSFDRYTNKIVANKKAPSHMQPKLRPNPFNPKARLMPNPINHKLKLLPKSVPAKTVPQKMTS